MKIALNGMICDDHEAVVSVYDHGFMYGIGLFETFRTYGGRPFYLERHMERLASGCEELGIRYTPDCAEARSLIVRLLNANGLEEAYIRFSVAAGTDVLGLPAGDYVHPNVIVYVKPLPARDELTYTEGKPVQLLELRRSSPEGRIRTKSFHYMNNILAKREMRGYEWAQGAEGIFLDGNGYLAEGIVSNLFWIKGQTLYTPSLDTGILPGITRQAVIELARRLGIEVREGLFAWTDLMAADEAFVTNSVQELVPVNSGYDGDGLKQTIGRGKRGAITAQLMKAYTEAVYS
ncbi:MAG: 4-amino-4-deoxychorismate lyase [Paenibacillus sp.]|jgi:4-amino-4-deoxychorismate lyase|nr:4-amino-4-deoxychorismate lyase [Paenibacillus sp.]